MSSQALAAAMMAALAASPATRASPLRVLVLVGGERERALAARVEGHAADLDAKIETVDAPRILEADRPVAAALSVAADRAAEIAVWFKPERAGWTVNVARGDRVFRRLVEESSGAMSDSAVIEAVALVVRTALKGLAAGEEIPAEGVPLRLWGEIGWAGVVERAGLAGRHGVAARLGGARGDWRLAAEVGFHPAATVSTANATIQVERITAGVVAGLDLLGRAGEGARWRLGPELGISASRYSRVTIAVGPGFASTAAKSTWSPVVTPAFRASMRLASLTWVSATLGADVVGRRPEFGVEGNSGFVVVTSLWAVEPRATLSLLIDVF